MWVMLITFFFYASAQARASTATVATAEFSSAATCEAARKQYLAQFAPMVDRVTAGAQSAIAGGTLQAPNGIIATALCARK